MNRWLAAFAACVLVAIVGLWRLTTRDDRPDDAGPRTSAVARAPLSAPLPSSRRRHVETIGGADLPSVPALPTSLAGTDVDGAFTTDEHGRFRVSDDVRRLFDYFLSTLGELDLDEVRALVRAQAQAELQDDAAVAAAMALFDQYLVYLEALQSVAEASSPAAGTLSDRFDEVERLQTDLFEDATAAAMFGEQNRVARAVLSRNELGPRGDYDGGDYDQRMAEVEANLPPGVRAALERDRAVTRVRDEVRRMRNRGASDQDIWDLRARHFGPAAADRLAELDRARARSRDRR